MESLFIIIPAYNEAANIEKVIEEWYPIVERHNGKGRSRLVIIDDGSRDDTLNIVKRQVAEREYLEVITRENSGHGSSIYFGYQYALESNIDYIFQTDSDGQTLATEFEQFWNRRHDYNVIIGKRAGRQDGMGRVFVSACLRILIDSVFKVKVEDVNTPYRLMDHMSLLRAIEYIPKEYNLTNVGLTAAFAYMSIHRVKGQDMIDMSYIPITFRPRQGGKNSINLFKIVKLGFRSLRDFATIKRKLTADL